MSTPDGGENSHATAGPLVVRLEDLNEVVHTLVRQAMAGSGEQAMAGGGEQQNPIAGSSDPCSGGKEG